MFAVIKSSGTQYKVEKGQKIEIDRLEDEEGKSITFDEVLLIGDKSKSKVGTPLVSGAKVTAKILGHKRGKKITVFKMKPKKRYKKTQGHRQDLTEVEITDIKG